MGLSSNWSRRVRFAESPHTMRRGACQSRVRRRARAPLPWEGIQPQGPFRVRHRTARLRAGGPRGD